MCGTGGEEGLHRMKEELEKEGYNVIDELVVSPMCNRNALSKSTKPKGDVIIVLACDAAVFNANLVFKGKKIIAALDTVGLGAWDENGNISMVKEFK